MRKYSIFMIVMVFFAVCSSECRGGEINNSEELTAYIFTTLAPITSYELSYIRTIYYPPERNEKEVEIMKNAISEYRRIIQEREENKLSKEEENKWKYISNEDFLEMIKDNERSLNGFQIDSTCIISMRDGKMRVDKYWTDKKPHYQCIIFDGSEGICIEENKLIKSNSITRMWMEPTSSDGFGINLNRFIQNGFSIIEYDSTARKLRVNSDVYYPKTHYFEFTLLEENPAYWKQCDNVDNGVVNKRVLCDHFKEISGMLIPETIVKQRWSQSVNGFIDDLKMTLSEARVNDIQFADDFFSTIPKENIEVEHWKR